MSRLSAEPGWVIDSLGYPEVRDQLWERADNWLTREHPVRWAWSQHASRRAEAERRVHDRRFAPPDTIRFRHPDETAGRGRHRSDPAVRRRPAPPRRA
ncbi:hypothetical protein AB0D11_23055 [Streptomyces monashensis]|uniref:hypothetical protein n=1 Tax=Streptomyces monashensis TaxID=1678012 RepID=UPI0033F65806